MSTLKKIGHNLHVHVDKLSIEWAILYFNGSRVECFLRHMRIFPIRTFLAPEDWESCLGPVFRPFTNSDQYSFQILLCPMDISTFS